MLANLTDRTKLRMTGSDRERYLGGQVTNDIRDLEPGGPALHACITNARGKLEADVSITALDDAYLIDADPALRKVLLARLEKYIIADDVTLEDVTEKYSLFHIIGDPSDHFDLPGAVYHPSLRYGPKGFDLWTKPGFPSPPATTSPSRLESLRISHGIPKWGAELTPDILPPEAGPEFVARAISYTKGCYIGQEVISRIRSAGKVNKLLVILRAEAPAAALEPGLELFTGSTEKPVGVITSCSPTPAIALAYVKTAHSAAGTRLTAGTANGPLAFPVTISKTPLILQ